MVTEYGVLFSETGVEFSSYPYPPASIYPSGTVAYATIREVVLEAAPPEIRTVRGEVLFVPAKLKEPLRAAADRHGIPIVSREDMWDLILEPFLDTAFDDQHRTQTLERLEANGIDRQLCEELRRRVSGARIAYNLESGLWDWTHLGLLDVLDALRGHLSGEAHRLSEAEFAVFYHQAMEIASRARLRER